MRAMNETTHDPQGVDDPALLAEIEAEFAELTREIERISAMPRSMAPEKGKLIEALRASWRTRLESAEVKDRPEWRQRLDVTLGNAVDKLIQDGIQENADGSLGFSLRSDTLQAEGGPVIRSLLDGFAHILEERFPTPDKAAPQPAPNPDAPPPNPLQAFMGNIGQAFAGVLKSAIQNVGQNIDQLSAANAGGAKATLKAEGVDINVTTKPLVMTEDGVTNADVGIATDQKIVTSIEFDSRVSTKTRAVPNDASPDAPKPSPASVAAGAATNAFFQQLMQGFGQAIKTAVSPQQAPAASPAAAQPVTAGSTQDGVQPQPSDAQPSAAPTGAAQPDATQAGAQANPLAGIGQILAQALQRAIGPNAAPVVLQSVPKPASEASDSAPATTDAPPPETATTPEAPKTPTLQIDFAGLLSQLLGNVKKPPGT